VSAPVHPDDRAADPAVEIDGLVMRYGEKVGRQVQLAGEIGGPG